MSVWRHLRAIGLLPGVVAFAVPALIVWRTKAASVGWGLPSGLALLPLVLGVGLIGLGLLLIVQTVALFAHAGRGTLAPLGPDISACRARPLPPRPQPDD